MHPVHSSFSTKHERLAIECSRPEVQMNCIPGQKWRCERDGHRWRRHKCKYVAPPPRISKKCACFTPNGVVYTRLESNDYDGHRYSFGRDRRTADVARYFARRGIRFRLSAGGIQIRTTLPCVLEKKKNKGTVVEIGNARDITLHCSNVYRVSGICSGSYAFTIEINIGRVLVSFIEEDL